MIAKETVNQLANKYLQIEQNTQYLTHIQHYNVSITFRKPIRLKENPALNPIIQVHSLCKIMVQFTYLLYTCFIYDTDIYIGPELLQMRRALDDKVEVKMQYLLANEFDNLECRPQRKQVLEKLFKKCSVSKSKYSYGQIVLSMLRDLLKKAKINITKLLSIKNINQQENEKQKRMYQGLQVVVEKYLERDVKKITKPKVIIQCLQETQMFRQYSSLLKIINCSLFYSMKLKTPKLEKLRQTKQLQIVAMKKKQKKSEAELIQKILDDFFLDLINKKVASITKTVNEIIRETERQDQSNLKVGTITNTKNGRLYEVRIKVHQRPMRLFDEKIYQEIYQKYEQPQTSTSIIQEETVQQAKKADSPKVSSSDFLIEVITDKEIIIVKYVTDIELNIQNTDVVMYQCNNIPFDLVSVTLELIQNSSAKPGGQNAPKKKDKIVVFKTMSHYNSKEQPLTKILLMIDLVMICAKILQPQLKRPNLKMQDYWRVEQLAKKSNHITNLFIRKASKLYNQIDNL